MYRLADLDPLHPPPLVTGDDPDVWRENRARIEKVWREYLGVLPEPIEVSWRTRAEQRIQPTPTEPAVTLLHIDYDAPGGRPGDVERVTAHLLVPDSARERPAPAVLALHPTHPRGKEAVTVDGVAPDRTYGLELARRGYVVLAPDVIASGERIEAGEEYWHTGSFYRSNPGWTVIGRMVTDHRQGVELLSQLPEVDAARIGAIGHSLGGYNAVFLAGLEPRVSAVVSSCGSSMWAGDPRPNRWYRGFPFIHLPRLGDDVDAGVVPFEWHEITALAAPRPLFVYATTGDDCFPHYQAIAAGLYEVERVYTVLGAAATFTFLLGTGPHTFPRPIRQAAYTFLDDVLSSGRHAAATTST
ncbi:dienelactone hydrolase family protein [Thermasporomyces composti]|jgi:dienelactone hydrolase|uniref:Dienelactone hydrolase family protein n=1 Tax=Thermasporomyces composti TaxID=696763 RepID=A0A3D9VFX7_THECX|nr:dienelactone hydrolase family protein [Thermasporomyces composti]REF36211.1 dienelactone hydrolase family protein [Thermasporomyces composti]